MLHWVVCHIYVDVVKQHTSQQVAVMVSCDVVHLQKEKGVEGIYGAQRGRSFLAPLV